MVQWFRVFQLFAGEEEEEEEEEKEERGRKRNGGWGGFISRMQIRGGEMGENLPVSVQEKGGSRIAAAPPLRHEEKQ